MAGITSDLAKKSRNPWGGSPGVSGQFPLGQHCWSTRYVTKHNGCFWEFRNINFYFNKPKRVFGLQVWWRELDTFKILEIFWEIFWKFWEFLREFFWNFFGGFFWRNLFGGIFWERFYGRIFLEEFFGRNYLLEINKELMFLSRVWGNARRRKDKKFRSLEVRGKLITLKNSTYIAHNLPIYYFKILALT